MEQLICHLVGDYVLQNHWMAQNKVKAWLPALIHATLYMLPFLLLIPSLMAFSVMWGTHLLIDRFRLARYWVEFYGVGEPGRLWAVKYPRMAGYDPRAVSSRYDANSAPDWLAVWLLIIVDNTLHLAINYASLTWL